MSGNAIRVTCAVLLGLVGVFPRAALAEPDVRIIATEISDDRPVQGEGVIVKVTIQNVGTTVATDVIARINGSDHFYFFPPHCAPLDDRECHFGDVQPGQVRYVKFATEVDGFVGKEIRDAALVVDLQVNDLYIDRAFFPVWIVGSRDR